MNGESKAKLKIQHQLSDRESQMNQSILSPSLRRTSRHNKFKSKKR